MYVSAAILDHFFILYRKNMYNAKKIGVAMRMYFFLIIHFISCTPSAITFKLNGGRFGDCVSNCCKAYYYAHKYHLKFLYQPFIYSDQLMLSQLEAEFHPDDEKQFSHTVQVTCEDDIKLKRNKTQNVLFVSNFYSKTPGLYEYGIQDPLFATQLKKLLMPIAPPNFVKKPENSMIAAVHVRKGGGFDSQCADQIWPTKFPPDQFYIDQIKILRKLVAQEKLLIIYLFTDDPNPGALAARYEKILNDASISFIYRQSDNSHDAHVIEDFYLMSQCDCLIRSSSLFAKAAQLLGNHEIIMYPVQGYWKDDTLIIDPVGIIMRNKPSNF